MTSHKPSLSVCMIVRNEAERIAGALASFRTFADEIVVVDTGSTDATRAIAERYTTRLFDFPWCDDFSAARNVSLSKARGDYILWLDADDQLNSENQEKVRRLKDYMDGKTAFYFVVRGGDVSDSSCSVRQLRCFPNRETFRFKGRVHEQIDHAVRASGLDFRNTDITIDHYGYLTNEVVEAKIRRNFKLMERELAEGRDDEHIHFYLALSYAHLGMGDKARTAMERAVVLMEKKSMLLTPEMRKSTDYLPYIREAFLFLARLHAEKAEESPALRYSTMARALIERNDENAQSFFRLGIIYQRLNKHPFALSCLSMALSGKAETGHFPLPPPPPEKRIAVDMAYSYLCLNQREQAMQCMKRAWEQGLEVCESWEQLGASALRDGVLKLSFEAYEAAYHTGNLSPDGYCNLAFLFDKRGSVEKAIQHYEEALRRVPGHQVAMANLAHLNMRLGRLGSAQPLYQQLTDAGSRDMDILLALAVIQSRQKEGEAFRRTHALIASAAGEAPPESSHVHEGFYVELADRLDQNNKTSLAGWAREIAREVGHEPMESKA